MRPVELHGERTGRNPHRVRRVVRFVDLFLKVWILRDMRHQFQNFVAYLLAALPAIRKNSVARQDHGGARLVVMAYLINPGVLDQLTWRQQAIRLVKDCDVCIFKSHATFVCVPFSHSASTALFSQAAVFRSDPLLSVLRSNSACNWDAFWVTSSWWLRNSSDRVYFFPCRQPLVKGHAWSMGHAARETLDQI
jgi:hypothetical protein